MAPKGNRKKNQTRLKKVVSRKSDHKRKAAMAKESASKKAEGPKPVGIEMDFIGPSEELGKLLFDLFQTHDLETGYAKEITSDVQIELLPARMAKDIPSVAVLLTIGSGVTENVASNYLWHKCGTFNKSRGIKILINREQYVNNEPELTKIIKTTMERETGKKQR
jgi:hypothetical protein